MATLSKSVSGQNLFSNSEPILDSLSKSGPSTTNKNESADDRFLSASLMSEVSSKCSKSSHCSHSAHHSHHDATLEMALQGRNDESQPSAMIVRPSPLGSSDMTGPALVEGELLITCCNCGGGPRVEALGEQCSLCGHPTCDYCEAYEI